MLVEARIYAIPPGRMGDITDRMLERVPPLFLRHDITAVAHWYALAGPLLPAFIYLIAWRDARHREDGWARFYDDPEWWEIRSQTNAGSELVDSYALWLATPTGHVDAAFDGCGFADNEIDDLVISHVPIGQNATVDAAFTQTIIPHLTDCGARVRSVLRANAGPRIPSVLWIVSWRDMDQRARAWADLDWHWGAASPLKDLGSRDVYLMKPLLPRQTAEIETR